MRLDLVTDTYTPDINGVAMTLRHLVEGLNRKGHYVHIIRADTTGISTPGETKVRSLKLLGYEQIRIGLPRPVKLRQRWAKKRPDVVYVATESPLGISAIQAASSLGIPVIAGFHTNFHQYLEQYHLNNLEVPALNFLKKIHNLANATLTPSQDSAQVLLNYGFKNVHLLGRGVDNVLYHPNKRSLELRASWNALDEYTPVYLIVGRVAPEKNLPLALDSFREIKATHPHAQCIVVGDGPSLPQLKADYPEAQFVGVKVGAELASHYASADIFLFPSETETFGNVLLEALASGLITISYDYAASAQHILHGKNGLKAPKGDSQAFTKLAHITAKHFSWASLRENATQSATQLSWDQVITTFETHLLNAAKSRLSPNIRRKKKSTLSYRSIFISDLHLGSPDAKAREVTDFLKHTRCEQLYLNGDIIDGWSLKRGSKWTKQHTKVIRLILKKIDLEKITVTYLRGNHDDIIARFLPLDFGRINFLREAIHTGLDGKRYLVIHGDGFDSISTNHKWLAQLGALGYDSLLKLNRFYNYYRTWCGKDYYSISKRIKSKVKTALSFVDEYERQLQNLARKKKCSGIICGHIHTPGDKQIGDIRYLNSGDWVESLTAIVEHHDGTFQVISYEDFLVSLGQLHRHSSDNEKKIIPLAS